MICPLQIKKYPILLILLKSKKKFNINYHKFNLIRLTNIDNNLDHIHNINFGTFCEMNLKNLNSIKCFRLISCKQLLIMDLVLMI